MQLADSSTDRIKLALAVDLTNRREYSLRPVRFASSTMIVKIFKIQTNNYMYLIVDPATKEAAAVDPVTDHELVSKVLSLARGILLEICNMHIQLWLGNSCHPRKCEFVKAWQLTNCFANCFRHL